jgi:hypothetical protein
MLLLSRAHKASDTTWPTASVHAVLINCQCKLNYFVNERVSPPGAGGNVGIQSRVAAEFIKRNQLMSWALIDFLSNICVPRESLDMRPQGQFCDITGTDSPYQEVCNVSLDDEEQGKVV